MKCPKCGEVLTSNIDLILHEELDGWGNRMADLIIKRIERGEGKE
jgi:hypothetical protein